MARHFLILFSALFLFCSAKTANYELTLQFSEIRGLVQGNPVVFKEDPIGAVTKVTYTKTGGFDVQVAISESDRALITEYSRFFVTENPENPSEKAIRMVLIRDGGTPLEDGSAVKGSDRTSVIISRVTENLESVLGEIEEEVDRLLNRLDRLSRSDEYRELKRQLERLSRRIREAEKSGREKLEKEIIPELKREMKELQKRLEMLFSEQKEGRRI